MDDIATRHSAPDAVERALRVVSADEVWRVDEADVVDRIADLLHLADAMFALGSDSTVDDVMDSAFMHFEAERA